MRIDPFQGKTEKWALFSVFFALGPEGIAVASPPVVINNCFFVSYSFVVSWMQTSLFLRVRCFGGPFLGWES